MITSPYISRSCTATQPILHCLVPTHQHCFAAVADLDEFHSATATLVLKGKFQMSDIFMPVTKQKVIDGLGINVTPLLGTATDATYM